MAADNGRVVSKLQAGQHNGVHRGVRACIVSMTMHGAQYARVFVYAPPLLPPRSLGFSLQATVYTERTGAQRRVSTVRPCILENPRWRFSSVHVKTRARHLCIR